MPWWDRLKPVPIKRRVHSGGAVVGVNWRNARCLGGTGFSREGVERRGARWIVYAQASSRLKPVPLKQSIVPTLRVVDARRPCFDDRLRRS
jgi:hypothetical protein